MLRANRDLAVGALVVSFPDLDGVLQCCFPRACSHERVVQGLEDQPIGGCGGRIDPRCGVVVDGPDLLAAVRLEALVFAEAARDAALPAGNGVRRAGFADAAVWDLFQVLLPELLDVVPGALPGKSGGPLCCCLAPEKRWSSSGSGRGSSAG